MTEEDITQTHVLCIVCKKRVEDGDDSSILTPRGLSSLQECCKRVSVDVHAEVGQPIHNDCRRRLNYNPKTTKSEDTISGAKRSRSSHGTYISDKDCLFCGTPVDFSGKSGSKNEAQRVRTSEFPKTVKANCDKRNDYWSDIVRGRIEFFSGDLHAYDCVYHKTCRGNFSTGKRIPKVYEKLQTVAPALKKPKCGRPINDLRAWAFESVCESLATNPTDEQITVQGLVSQMRTLLVDTDASEYEPQYMKKKLLEHFGHDIIFSSVDGESDILTVRHTADGILRKFYMLSRECTDLEEQKRNLIEAAAKIIRNDIKETVNPCMDAYPSTSELDCKEAISYLPESLQLLMSGLITGKDTIIKQASIGQCIIQSVLPRSVISPLQIGLAVQLHHQFRSRFLIDTLNALGFSSSYDEVLKFERNAAVSSGVVDLPELHQASTVIMSADNVDHNTCTLDGKNTLHGMGMIASITPRVVRRERIQRRAVASSELCKMADISILEFRHSKKAKKLLFEKLNSCRGSELQTNLLWELSWHFKNPRPNWSGAMQTFHSSIRNDKTDAASVIFLPIIDLSPTDMSCILSTLVFLKSTAMRYGKPAIITFDQPLFWKASLIINNYPDLEDICLLLGAFHTVMNLLGAVGTVMEGSGLSDILEKVYAGNTIVQILSGKAYARAVRAHSLVNSALNILIFEEVLGCGSHISFPLDEPLAECSYLFEELMSGNITVDTVENNKHLSELDVLVSAEKARLHTNSTTSSLWLEYQNMISVIRKLITADRLNDFELHKEGIRLGIPIFASAGHHHYLKSAYLYLQKMEKLEDTHPVVYRQFKEHGNAVKRSDRKWAGLAPDLVIEQVLMRSIKSVGGLTRGSGVSENQRATWLASVPISAEFNFKMQSFTEVFSETNEQHKGLSTSTMTRDRHDITEIVDYIKQYSPFTDDPILRNIVTGVVAAPGVDVDQLFSFGESVACKMEEQNVFEFSLKRKDKVTTLASGIAVVKDGVRIDPALLFQRLYVLAANMKTSLEDALEYELCAYPPSLFESKDIPRKADKPPLAKAILQHVNKSLPLPKDKESSDAIKKMKYVLDGGSLLMRLPWRKGLTYGEIALQYSEFVTCKYGEAIVVFDGYQTPSTKDVTHSRRSKSLNASVPVHFKRETPFFDKKEKFLENEQNKIRMIDMIASELEACGCRVLRSSGDADVDIVKTAVQSADIFPTTLIGEDTDLLVLLLYWARETGHELVFRSDRNQKTSKSYDIRLICSLLGKTICQNLLFLHAFSGCDTTSRIFNIGKQKAFAQILEDYQLQEISMQFLDATLSSAQTEELGAKAMLSIFGGKDETLTKCRHRYLVSKVSSAKYFVKPETLPPTAAATKYHSQRVYHQVQTWTGNTTLNPLDWGWSLCDGRYVPQTTDLPAAPDSLLRIVRCNCASGCATARCSCRSHGLLCSVACGKCQESMCSNYESGIEDDTDE